jgi:hypothetical protein
LVNPRKVLWQNKTMGLFNFSVSNLYNRAKSVVSDVFNTVKSGVGTLAQAKSWISEHVDKLSSIPYIGEELKAGARKLAEEPILFGASLNDVGAGIDMANKYINSPYLTEGAARFDNWAQSAAQTADTALAGRAG